MEFRTTNPDNLVFALLDSETAEQVIHEDKAEVFKIYNDDTTEVVQYDNELVENPDYVFGICLGFEHELKSDYNEACARSNERRSFDAWLEARAENFIE